MGNDIAAVNRNRCPLGPRARTLPSEEGLNMQPSWTGFALAACVLAAGCSTSSSSSSGGTDCTMFSACGGDVTGTWTLTKACTSGAPNPLATQCPSSTFQIVETVGGTINFKSDGTYSANTTSSSAGDFTLPPSCLRGPTCAHPR